MNSIPLFAVAMDTENGTPPLNNSGEWWSLLAMGADGLTCDLTLTDDQWWINSGAKKTRTDLAQFILTFGHACALVWVVLPSTNATTQNYENLAQQLERSSLRWQTRLLVPFEHVGTIRTIAPSVATYALNIYGGPMPGERNQAFGMDAALTQFPGLVEPAGGHSANILLVDMRPSGLLQPAAWLVQPSGQSPLRQHKAFFSESFDGNDAKAVALRWGIGYSNITNESSIALEPSKTAQNAALALTFDAGFSYSGGGAVCRTPIVGNFDLQVGFSCTRRSLAATLEMAVITIDPPPPSHTSIIRKGLKANNTSLVFDVHGAPPYVSCECDEADGFRIGWNRAYTVTNFVDTLYGSPPVKQSLAQSANHYNRYGDDAGAASTDAIEGELRLVRSHGFFASYFRIKGETLWQCSGTLWNEQLPGQLYVRLAAKHWGKRGTDDQMQTVPELTVRFFNFRAACPDWSTT